MTGRQILKILRIFLQRGEAIIMVDYQVLNPPKDGQERTGKFQSQVI